MSKWLLKQHNTHSPVLVQPLTQYQAQNNQMEGETQVQSATAAEGDARQLPPRDG